MCFSLEIEERQIDTGNKDISLTPLQLEIYILVSLECGTEGRGWGRDSMVLRLQLLNMGSHVAVVSYADHGRGGMRLGAESCS